MIFPNPTAGLLRAAQVITFFDPQRPEFHIVLVDNLDRTKRTPTDLLVIDIPIDSTKPEQSQQWLDRIAAVREGDQVNPSESD